jgi:hypothetical protein
MGGSLEVEARFTGANGLRSEERGGGGERELESGSVYLRAR